MLLVEHLTSGVGDPRAKTAADAGAESGLAASSTRCGCGADTAQFPVARNSTAHGKKLTAMSMSVRTAAAPERQARHSGRGRSRGRGRWGCGGCCVRPRGFPALLALAAGALLWPAPPPGASAAAFPPPPAAPAFAEASLFSPPQQMYAPGAALYPSPEEYEAAVRKTSLRLLEPEMELEVERAMLLRDLQEQVQVQQALAAAARSAAARDGEMMAPPPPQAQAGAPEGLPAALPLVAMDAREEPPVKKMKSYMSLCLFKICNMGRKRTNRS